MEEQIVRIITRNAKYLLPIKIVVGDYYNISINCESYKIEDSIVYGFIGTNIVFWMYFIDIEDILFERCV